MSWCESSETRCQYGPRTGKPNQNGRAAMSDVVFEVFTDEGAALQVVELRDGEFEVMHEEGAL